VLNKSELDAAQAEFAQKIAAAGTIKQVVRAAFAPAA
jgi:hypothetical protein